MGLQKNACSILERKIGALGSTSQIIFDGLFLIVVFLCYLLNTTFTCCRTLCELVWNNENFMEIWRWKYSRQEPAGAILFLVLGTTNRHYDKNTSAVVYHQKAQHPCREKSNAAKVELQN